jgi:hypothetical protein
MTTIVKIRMGWEKSAQLFRWRNTYYSLQKDKVTLVKTFEQVLTFQDKSSGIILGHQV